MIKIGICDDEEIDRSEIRHICIHIAKERSEKICIYEYSTAKDFLLDNKKEDILILDIEMQDMSGVELKNKLQNRGINIFIIFVSNHGEMITSAFGINVFGFVNKNNLYVQLPEVLSSVFFLMNQYIILDEKWDSRKILYIHSERIYSCIHLTDGTQTILRKPISKLENELDCVGFIRLHRSYLVNAMMIDGISEAYVYIAGEKIPVSIRNRKEVKEKYRLFCEKNARYY
mgnify:CR=1 FL=1